MQAGIKIIHVYTHFCSKHIVIIFKSYDFKIFHTKNNMNIFVDEKQNLFKAKQWAWNEAKNSPASNSEAGISDPALNYYNNQTKQNWVQKSLIGAPRDTVAGKIHW